jgi:lipoate-protein ligase A
VHEGTVNEDLLERHARLRRPVWRVYEPEGTIAVLGAGGDPERDLFLDALLHDAVPYRFRRGGGGTVILSPGQAVLALVTEVRSPFDNREYARRINVMVVDTLSSLGVQGIEQRGISDLAIRERKILGTSIYRRRLVLFYQASLLVDNDITLFDRYLRMPARVPDYRGGRSHAEFCTTLVREGFSFSVPRVIDAIEKTVEERIKELS